MMVGTGGEIGDLLYALPTIRSLRIPHIRNLERLWTRPQWLARSKSLKRLVESQDYIDSFQDWSGEPIIDLTTYRANGMKYGDTIIERIARHAGVKPAFSPWLQVEPSKSTEGLIIISRCPRWKSFWWPYKSIVAQLRPLLRFIGTDQEHKDFCAEFGFIERILCSDMLEVAQAIAGSLLFIGNQSSPFAIAEALHHPSVLEVCPTACDCVTHRANCVYSVDGSLDFEVAGKRIQIESMVQPYSYQVGGRMISGRSEWECETMARAEHVIQGLPLPPIAAIRSGICPSHLPNRQD